MNKPALLQQIIAALQTELDGYTRSAKAAHSEATDEQSRAENKYDTRGLEASYLARGQSRQALEVIEAIQHFSAMGSREFARDEGVDLGALVGLEESGALHYYFIGPRSGGLEVMHEDHPVLVITPHSPLGQRLVGRKIGETLRIPNGGAGSAFRVASIV